MGRSTPVTRSRNGRAGADGPVASESETLVLRATPSIKRYNIARFDLPELPHFSSCAQPVMMYREPERESEGNNKFNGTLEGGQSSTYMLLVKNRRNDEFSVMLVEQWFRFKKPLSYRTLTLEEAEEMNNEKKRAVERWLMKHKIAGEDKAENDDIFGVAETARPRRVPSPKARGEGATGKDGGDFEEKFDDDESAAEIYHDEPQGLESVRTKTSLKWILKDLAS
ncbi:hypothetical protein PsorP6_000145 [Peronosclerospora sorghi]|uniref:Uncharacterized protein n=1 Tax=Peronosclerospora sorghi TaxID=230839 RepID=A0ACC0WXE0_9STRA|nr:hypothetical protein PsorP6_000145 [Peronosclerospora sorghi]